MDDLNSEKTLPPARAIRFDRLTDLFGQVPQCGELLHRSPDDEDGYRSFLELLRASQTPEDAVTFTAFALQPKAAVQWGLDSVLSVQGELSAEDTEIVNLVEEWLRTQGTDARWKAFERALFAPRKTAIVYLGLAVGWSGGPLAPNDLVTVPAWRTPRAISAGVLRAIGLVGTENRQDSLDQVLDKAAGLFRVH